MVTLRAVDLGPLLSAGEAILAQYMLSGDWRRGWGR